MAAPNPALLNILANELPHLSDDELKVVFLDLNTMMKTYKYKNMATLINDVWAIIPDAFPRSYTRTGLEATLKRHTMALLHLIITPANQFDFDWDNYFNWTLWKKKINED